MSLFIQSFHTEGIAELSYLIGDDSSGIAAVIDPRRDCDLYIEAAREQQVTITKIFETHIHADFVSGARELAARCLTAEIHASVEGDAEYDFDVSGVKDGDKFEFGELTLVARHTPGHTPEHMSYEAIEKDHDKPFAVFTGDSLFVSSAGRPDLLGDNADELASKLYDTLFDYFGKLDDGVMIYPGHGAGSPCGAGIGDRMESTIGYEKAHNPYYQKTDREEFVDHALSTAPPEPTYYKRMKKVNAAGPEVLGHTPRVPALTPKQFEKQIDSSETLLIDTRSSVAFGGGHIPGAWNIGGKAMLTVWAGWMVDPEKKILLVLDSDSECDEIVKLFLRSGFSQFAGYLAGGVSAWAMAGKPLDSIPQTPVDAVAERSDNLQIIDVRSPSEFKKGHIPGAKHIFVPNLEDETQDFDKEKPLLTYCASGYRASLAASLLKSYGFSHVETLPGSFAAWKADGRDTTTSD